MPLEVTTNGQDFSGPTPPLRFTYYAAPVLERTAPLFGPIAGVTLTLTLTRARALTLPLTLTSSS